MNAQWMQVETAGWRSHAEAGAALAPLVEINTQCVELLCGMASRPAPLLPPLLAGAPHAWRSLSPGACQKLAGVPWLLVDAGFEGIKVDPRRDSGAIIAQCMPGAETFLASAVIEATKPGGASCCGPSCCT